TLYAALSEIKNDEDKIITIEDPVEYQIRGITKIPVKEKKGLTFARGLRSILRHDPDKIMVGEIRDSETAQIAIQSALTGHLVLTTAHANHVCADGTSCFDDRPCQQRLRCDRPVCLHGHRRLQLSGRLELRARTTAGSDVVSVVSRSGSSRQDARRRVRTRL